MLDFNVAHSLYRGHAVSDCIAGMAEIIALTSLSPDTQGLTKGITEKIKKYVRTGTAEMEELKETFDTLQRYLMEHWFSELNLGIIPASMIEGDKKAPAKTPIKGELSSHIG